MGKRYELTDEAWTRIEPLMPRQSRGGKWNEHRQYSTACSGFSIAGCSRRGIEAVIPTRTNQPRGKFSHRKYRHRNSVERCIGWLRCCRRIATRHEKLATSFLAMVKLAMIQRCLRLLDP